MNELAGLKILITRPKPQAEKLAEELVKLGALPTVFPALQINPILNAELDELNFKDIDKILFISPNAVIHSVGLDPKKWQTIPTSCHIISMGSGTTETLQDYKIRVDIELPQGGTSETLLTHSELLNVKQQNIVIIAGAGGRDVLENTLQQRGAKVEKIVVYQRSKPKKLMPQWHERFDILLATSGESLENLKDMLLESNQQALMKLPLLLISDRLERIARKLGFTGEIHLSKGASDNAIKKSLVAWW